MENRLREEDYMFYGMVSYPKNPRLHMYMSIAIALCIELYNIVSQIPPGTDLENASIDDSMWMCIPFIYLAYLLEDKRMFRSVCDKIRDAAKADQVDISYIMLENSAYEVMRKLVAPRIFMLLKWLAIWFLLVNVGLIIYISIYFPK